MSRRFPARSVAPTADRPAAAARKIQRLPSVRRPLRWIFMVFLFSVPFQAFETGFSDTISISKIAGYLLLLTALIFPDVAFRKVPGGALWFFVYLGVFLLDIFNVPSFYAPEIRSRLFTMVQVMGLFVISFNLLRYESLATNAMRAFALGSALVAIGNIVGLTASEEVYHGEERVSAFGADPNSVGSMFALGLLAFVALVYGRKGAKGWEKTAALICFPLLALAIAKTGSRGAVVSMCGGLVVFIFRKGTATQRLASLAVVAVALVLVVLITFSLSMNKERWSKTMESGSMAGRERIYPAAWRVFRDRPILGWGPVQNYYELGVRLDLPRRDTHNLFLWLLTEVGLVGFVPFCVGLTFAFLAAWRARRGPSGALPLMLMVSVFLVNMSITWLSAKLFWLVLAYAFASASPILLRPRRIAGVEAAASAARSLPARTV